jgi:hypothetical protein
MVSTQFLRQAAFASLTVLLMTSMVQAQQRGGFGLRLDRARLLGAEKVRTELKIEGDQATKVEAALDAYRKERSASPRPDFQNMSQAEREAYLEKTRPEREAMSKKADETLGVLLEPAQVKRLDEIGLQLRLQMAAIGTLKSDEVKGKLSLTEEQLTKLTEAQTAAEAELRKLGDEARAAGQGGFAGMREKFEGLQKKTKEAAMAVLTEEQKTALTALQGEPSKIEMSDLRGGGPGRGNRPAGQ